MSAKDREAEALRQARVEAEVKNKVLKGSEGNPARPNSIEEYSEKYGGNLTGEGSGPKGKRLTDDGEYKTVEEVVVTAPSSYKNERILETDDQRDLSSVIEAKSEKGRFNIDKPSTAKNSFMYTLHIKDYETYKKNKSIILKLFSKSIEMSIDHKIDRLEINNRKKVFFAKKPGDQPFI